MMSNVTALSVAKSYGVALLKVLEGALGASFTKLPPPALLKAAKALSLEQDYALVSAMFDTHKQHASELLRVVHKGAPDELAVIDSSAPLHGPTLAKLLLYAEVVICPDPFVEHHFGISAAIGAAPIRYPGPAEQLQKEFFDVIKFYSFFAEAIREGILLPTDWHVVSALKRHIQTSPIGALEGDELYDSTMGAAFKDIVEHRFVVKPAKYDGTGVKIYDFSKMPRAQTSQIAVMAKGDPSFISPNVQTYMKIVSAREENGQRLMQLAELPPDSNEEFERWIQDSKRKELHNRVVALQSALLLATRVRGAVVTVSETNNEILRALTEDTVHNDSRPATAIATMDLPMLDGLQLADIIRVRRDVESLQSFRTNFRRACASIKTEVGTAGFKKETDAIARDTIEQGIRDLDLARRALNQKLVGTAVFSTLMLTMSLAQAGLGHAQWIAQWIPAALGGIAQLKAIIDSVPKQNELKQKPYFMLWKLSPKPFEQK